MTIEEKIKGLPSSPGVYLMYDDAGKVIYVGKAVSLKNRVRQYFNNGAKLPKVQAMVDSVADFGYIITLSEKDALSLEANLVKKYMPRYNILLKDDKHSPYIRINLVDDYPRVEVVRRHKKDGARYFGPYFGGIHVNDVVDVIRGAYRVRTCKRMARRECLNYHIGLCLAPCTGKASLDEYRAAVNKVVAFLSGKNDEVEKLLEGKMMAAAEDEQFERAIEYRERLKMLETLKERNLSGKDVLADTDAFAFVSDGTYGAVSVNLVRGNKMMGVRNYSVTDASFSARDTAVSFVLQYYGQGGEIPSEILFSTVFAAKKQHLGATTEGDKSLENNDSDLGVNSNIKTDVNFDSNNENAEVFPATDAVLSFKGTGMAAEASANFEGETAMDFSALEQYLSAIRGGAVNIVFPQKGMKRRLVEMAEKNAEDYLEGSVEKIRKGRDLTVGAAERLKNILGIKSARRIECYDISNISGTDSVASGVVFIDGAAAKSEYRRYRIKTVVGADDYASMREVIARRLNGDSEQPDLFVIDGGKGQLSAAHGIIKEICDVPVISLAEKDELIFTTKSDQPIALAKSDYALRLLVRLRDEAHRFALSYHQTLRGRRQTSELLGVVGVGKKKLERITKSLTFKEIKSLPAEEIAQRAGIDLTTARNIEDFYKDKSTE